MPPELVLEGDETVRVVGTSHYQDALRELAARAGDDEVRREVIAEFVREPENPHDPDAIAVHVDGRLVGYLSRAENARWRDVLKPRVGAEALIAGKAGTAVLGVFLRLPTPTEARAQISLWQRGREAR